MRDALGMKSTDDILGIIELKPCMRWYISAVSIVSWLTAHALCHPVWRSSTTFHYVNSFIGCPWTPFARN
jgi:hypothetical protein